MFRTFKELSWELSFFVVNEAGLDLIVQRVKLMIEAASLVGKCIALNRVDLQDRLLGSRSQLGAGLDDWYFRNQINLSRFDDKVSLQQVEIVKHHVNRRIT